MLLIKNLYYLQFYQWFYSLDIIDKKINKKLMIVKVNFS